MMKKYRFMRELLPPVTRQPSLKKFPVFLLCFLQLITVHLFAQTDQVSGVVRNEKGDPLPSISVVVKGTSTGTTTNTDGRFSLTVPGKQGTLVFSGVGVPQKEVAIEGKSTIVVELQVESQGLGEVVVVGYGTQKKATLTGSVASVKGSEIIKSPATNVSNSLAGRIAGLVTVTPSGEPGYDGSVLRIRGVNTLNNNTPLIVVDGVPGRSLDRVDPSTIESMSVLKDASAAIYGAQAANGVILITTKRGKPGKPMVSVTYNQGFGRPTRIPEMADAPTYAAMLNEIADYAGKDPIYTPDQIQKFRDGSDPWYYPNTDWFKEVLRPWSPQNYGNVSLSGGSEDMRYFVSLSTRNQDGYYYNSGTKYHQYDFRTNLDGNVSKYVSIAFDVAGRLEDRNFPTRSAGSIFRMVMRGKPNMTAYWPNGTPGPDIEYGDNPVVVSTKATGYDRDKRYVLNSNGRINIKVPWVKGLSFTGNAALDKTFRFHKNWQTPWYLYSFQGFDANNEPILEKGKKGINEPKLFEEMEDVSNILLNGLLNYETKFLKNNYLNLLVGVERITGKGDNFNAFRQYYISAEVDQLFAGAERDMNNGGASYEEQRLNYFGRVNYNYKEKFLAEFVWRYQGSYIFAEDNRFGFFPGISVGYKISEEDFWQNAVPFVNSMKIRGSWGRTGNDLVEPFNYLNLYSYGGTRAQNGNPPLPFITNGNVENKALYEIVVPNPNITWEIANQFNIGFDAQLFYNKLFITADYFNYKRSDILAFRNASVPTSAGFVLPRENIGEVGNKGFDFSIGYTNRAGQWQYSLNMNGGYQKNKILFWDEPPGGPEYQKSTGHPIGSSLYYKAIGIFHDEASLGKYPAYPGARTGDVMFEDVNGDGKIDGNDRIRIDKSDIPNYTGGFAVNVLYKGFDLAVLVQGAFGGVRYISTESGEIGNFLQSFAKDRWTEDNPNAAGPRTFNRSNEYWVGQANTYWLLKTDYVRLKNVELGYSLPKKWLDHIRMDNIRVYVNAYNFLTWSAEMKDFDPELGTGSGQGYPLQKILNFGASVTF